MTIAVTANKPNIDKGVINRVIAIRAPHIYVEAFLGALRKASSLRPFVVQGFARRASHALRNDWGL